MCQINIFLLFIYKLKYIQKLRRKKDAELMHLTIASSMARTGGVRQRHIQVFALLYLLLSYYTSFSSLTLHERITIDRFSFFNVPMTPLKSLRICFIHNLQRS